MNKKETYNTSDRNDARQRKIKRIYLVTATTAALAFSKRLRAAKRLTDFFLDNGITLFLAVLWCRAASSQTA